MSKEGGKPCDNSQGISCSTGEPQKQQASFVNIEACRGVGGTLRSGRYAALDIGTVTCRMLVADVTDVGIQELAREYTITNLGDGVDASGVLKPEAMQRVARAIDCYQGVLDGFRTKEYPDIAITTLATSAARDARNADDFKALLAQRGLELAVISGEHEAALSFRGAACDFGGERLIVVDIGGGSTEIVAGRAGEKPLRSHSFNIGCRRVTEKFLLADPPTAEEIERARMWVRKQLEPFFAQLAKRSCATAACGAPNKNFDRLVAVAGTATSVVSISERMRVYDALKVHKMQVSRGVLDEVYGRMCSIPLLQRERVVGLDPGRAPVIVAGLLILQEVLTCVGFDTFTVSEQDILHGMVLEAASAGNKKGLS